MSELQSVLPMKCLPIPFKKLNIILMCIMPLMVPILKSTEHIKTLRDPVFENIPISPVHFMVEDMF
jgi:hypothetical protein